MRLDGYCVGGSRSPISFDTADRTCHLHTIKIHPPFNRLLSIIIAVPSSVYIWIKWNSHFWWIFFYSLTYFLLPQILPNWNHNNCWHFRIVNRVFCFVLSCSVVATEKNRKKSWDWFKLSLFVLRSFQFDLFWNFMHVYIIFSNDVYLGKNSVYTWAVFHYFHVLQWQSEQFLNHAILRFSSVHAWFRIFRFYRLFWFTALP